LRGKEDLAARGGPSGSGFTSPQQFPCGARRGYFKRRLGRSNLGNG